jgi:hypothetical protein
MVHNTLANYYQQVFNMNRHHNITPDVVENLMPFERDLYLDMILHELEKQQQAAAKHAGVEYAFGE